MTFPEHERNRAAAGQRERLDRFDRRGFHVDGILESATGSSLPVCYRHVAHVRARQHREAQGGIMRETRELVAREPVEWLVGIERRQGFQRSGTSSRPEYTA